MPAFLLDIISYLPSFIISLVITYFVMSSFKTKDFWYYFALVAITVSLTLYINGLTTPFLGIPLSAVVSRHL